MKDPIKRMKRQAIYWQKILKDYTSVIKKKKTSIKHSKNCTVKFLKNIIQPEDGHRT